MKLNKFLLLLIALPLSYSSFAQQTLDKLHLLENSPQPVYFSTGQEERAAAISQRFGRAYAYFKNLLSFSPIVTLLVLDSTDWNMYKGQPVVYGMAHFDEKNKRLILAAQENPFWRSFIPPIELLPESLRSDIKKAYHVNGNLSMQPFFDLLALHELGHSFHQQGNLNIQRKWMGELFVNLLLHTYIAEKEPASLPALTLFPRMVVAGGSKGMTFTSLEAVHTRYEEIGRKYPRNYGWYQCRWHVAAGQIYDNGGSTATRKVWDALKGQQKSLNDQELLAFLTATDTTIGDMVRYWERDRIR